MIADDCRVLAHERAAKYPPVIVARLPDPREFTRAYMGDYSYTVQAPERKRYLYKPILTFPHNVPQTPPELARDYLTVKFDGVPLRAFAAQRDLLMAHRSQPLYAEPGAWDYAAYVDLKSAYWQIMLAFGWNVDYWPGKFVAQKADMSDFPYPDNKMARNSMVTAGLPGPLRIWQDGQIIEKTGKKKINVGIWALAQDILHMIASQALDLGAVYVNTDGYIFPYGRHDDFCSWLDDLGIVWKLKEQGRAIVKGVGAWSIGGKRTGLFDGQHPGGFMYVYDPDNPAMLADSIRAFWRHREVANKLHSVQ